MEATAVEAGRAVEAPGVVRRGLVQKVGNLLFIAALAAVEAAWLAVLGLVLARL